MYAIEPLQRFSRSANMIGTKLSVGGPNICINPYVRSAFFLRDTLVQALRVAKMTRRFGLRKCRVVGAETPTIPSDLQETCP